MKRANFTGILALVAGCVLADTGAAHAEDAQTSLRRGYVEFYEATKKNPQASPSEVNKRKMQILAPRTQSLAREIGKNRATLVQRLGSGKSGSLSNSGAKEGGGNTSSGSTPAYKAPSRPAEPATAIDGRDVPTMLTFPGSKK